MAETKLNRSEITRDDGVTIISEENDSVLEVTVRIDKKKVVQQALPEILKRLSEDVAQDEPKRTRGPNKPKTPPLDDAGPIVKPGKEKDRVPGNIEGQKALPLPAVGASI